MTKPLRHGFPCLDRSSRRASQTQATKNPRLTYIHTLLRISYDRRCFSNRASQETQSAMSSTAQLNTNLGTVSYVQISISRSKYHKWCSTTRRVFARRLLIQLLCRMNSDLLSRRSGSFHRSPTAPLGNVDLSKKWTASVSAGSSAPEGFERKERCERSREDQEALRSCWLNPDRNKSMQPHS